MIKTFADANRLMKDYYPTKVNRPDIYTLDYVMELLDYVGNPQEAVRIVHVAGTSGKTSTAYYAAALLQAAGARVGLSVSPHVYEINERLQIDLVPLEEKQFCEALATFMELVRRSKVRVTFFEIISAFAYWYFARQQVDYAVIEVGMGGLLDATNVSSRADKVAVITDIGLDHQGWLGDTIRDIAAHKAGIIQFKNPAFMYRQDSAIMDVVMRRAAQKHADLHTYSAPRLPTELHHLPRFQQRNFYLALQAVRFALHRDGQVLSDTARDAAAQTAIPGRLQAVRYKGRTILLDGAHNAQKLHALGESLRERYPKQGIAVMAAFVTADEHRLPAAAVELAAFADHLISTTPPTSTSQRAFEDGSLVIAHAKTAGQWSAEVRPGLANALDALAARSEPVLVVTGSLYLLAAVVAHIHRS